MAKHTQVSFTGGEWTPTLDARVDLPRFKNSLGLMENMFVHAHGPISNRAGFEFIRETADSTRQTKLIPFTFSVDGNQTYILEFGHEVMRVHKDGATVLDEFDDVYELATPYHEDDVRSLRFTQSNDVVTICHKDYETRELFRLDHDDWVLEVKVFAPEISAPTGLAALREGGNGDRIIEYRVSAVDQLTGEESNASDKVTITDADPTMYNTNANAIAVDWAAVAGTEILYRLYRWDDYDKPLWGLLAETEDLEFRDQGNVIPDTSKSFQITQTPFSEFNPSATPTYFKQRLCFAHEQKFFMTQSGNYKNMNISKPVAADDAITYALSSESANSILHLLPMVGDLLAFTAGGVWTITSGSDAFSLLNLRVNKQIGDGSSHIPPLAVNDTVLMIGTDNKSVHDLGYSYEVDKYQGNDLAIMADHLFDGRTIEDRTFQQYPHRILWLPMSDGAFLGMTYMREHNVWGWHRHSTAGFVESVASVREGNEDAFYAVIRRTINGAEKRYIERMRSRSFSSIEDAFFVDCGATYDGEPAQTITGLDHLEGEAVSVLADGQVQENITVTGGQITLDEPASKVHVGLPYYATMRTLDILSEREALYGVKKTVNSVVMGFYKTLGGYLGVDLEEMQPIPARINEDGYDAVGLFTGKIAADIPSIASEDGRFYYQQRDPLPVTITAYEVDYVTSE